MIMRLNTLRARHEILEAKIDREQMRPRPDSLQVTALKKIRLRLREQIAAIERMLDSDSQDRQRRQTTQAA